MSCIGRSGELGGLEEAERIPNIMSRTKSAVTISLVVCLFGFVHAMNHHEFHRLYFRLLNDADSLVNSMAHYVTDTVLNLGLRRDNEKNRSVEVAARYDVMVNNARPLFDLFENDYRDLMIFFSNLESVRHVMKFLYAHFRQSAINIIDQLKRVYELS